MKVAGKSLLEWAFFSARESNLFSQICISTDDIEIANHAKSLGAEIHFMRPASLALDTSLQIDVINHAVDFFYSRGVETSSLTLLQPTSPFRYPKDLINAHSIWDSHEVNSLISVTYIYEDGQLNVAVSDNGRGIDPKEYKSIFLKFYRIGDENTRENKGTGLGLFLVKQILKSHKANIRAEANMPQGTTFYITFK